MSHTPPQSRVWWVCSLLLLFFVVILLNGKVCRLIIYINVHCYVQSSLTLSRRKSQVCDRRSITPVWELWICDRCSITPVWELWICDRCSITPVWELWICDRCSITPVWVTNAWHHPLIMLIEYDGQELVVGSFLLYHSTNSTHSMTELH